MTNKQRQLFSLVVF